MMKRSLRVSPAEFRGRSPDIAFSLPFCAVRGYRRESGDAKNRFGIAVGARVDSRSTRRHFWKRRVGEAVKMWPEVGMDFIISTLPAIRNETPPRVKSDLGRAGNRLFGAKS
ncbi:hypothetical protein C4587_01285 [Candidatus Parcubacteria bacterium]|nr:MAG: hypothetical protein C4587_01285 [Candidatus Parcubacteria bacterium]